MNNKERYERCKREHRCPNCFNKHDGVFLYCDKCRNWRKRYNKPRYCRDCGKKIDDSDKSKRCPSCKSKIKKTYWINWYSGLPKERRDGVREYYKKYAVEWRKGHPQKYQDTTIKRRYNITFYIAQELYESQNGRCAICEREIPFLDSPTRNRTNWAHIDHDHISNNVRGLLCPSCNHLLGNCKDDISILRNAINYLSAHSTK